MFVVVVKPLKVVDEVDVEVVVELMMLIKSEQLPILRYESVAEYVSGPVSVPGYVVIRKLLEVVVLSEIRVVVVVLDDAEDVVALVAVDEVVVARIVEVAAFLVVVIDANVELVEVVVEVVLVVQVVEKTEL